MAHILLTEEGRDAYLAEHAGVEDILQKLIDRLGADRAIRIASDLNDVITILDDILPTP